MHALGEFGLLQRIAGHLTGAGDDAAVVSIGEQRLVLATDALVQGRHWRADLSSFEDVGWKAIAVNVSDLAAMGHVTPRAALVALLLPADTAPEQVDALYVGIHDACSAYGLDLVGGDTTAADELALAVTVVGELADRPGEAVWRHGAAPGDALVIVGALGASAAALVRAEAGLAEDAEASAAHRRPQALLAAGRVLAEYGATAMIDLSDGLGQDMAHIASASGVHALFSFAALPIAASAKRTAQEAGIDLLELVCGGGEDYALLAALPADVALAAAEAAAAAQGVPAAVVGTCLPDHAGREPVRVMRGEESIDITTMGWDHFNAKGHQ